MAACSLGSIAQLPMLGMVRTSGLGMGWERWRGWRRAIAGGAFDSAGPQRYTIILWS
jgi:hypothetical protein